LNVGYRCRRAALNRMARHVLREWLTAYFGLSPVTGLFATVAFRLRGSGSSQRWFVRRPNA